MVVFLCGIVTIMLIGFIGYHTWLINRGFTTNEQVRNYKIKSFVEGKATFMEKWAKAREEKKAFKPTKKTIAKYEVDGDIRTDLTDAEVYELKEKVYKQHEIIKAGTFFPHKNFLHALMRIWNPDKYDIDGNPEEVSLEKPKPRPSRKDKDGAPQETEETAKSEEATND